MPEKRDGFSPSSPYDHLDPLESAASAAEHQAEVAWPLSVDTHLLNEKARRIRAESRLVRAQTRALRESMREDLVEAARDTPARLHHTFAALRQVIRETEETLQHSQAQREHLAEKGILLASTPPRTDLDILLIEDNPADVVLFRLALKECAPSSKVTVLAKGNEVQAFIRQVASAASLSPPHLIISDSRIPGMEAEDILAAVRTVPAYHHIPVLLFSALTEAVRQERSAKCGATAFIQKPGDLEAFVAAVATLMRQWGGVSVGAAPGLAREETC